MGKMRREGSFGKEERESELLGKVPDYAAQDR
jgi:hypothetical protein